MKGGAAKKTAPPFYITKFRLAQEKPPRIGNTGAWELFYVQNLVQYSDIVNQPYICYGNHTIFGTTKVYFIPYISHSMVFYVRVFGGSPDIPTGKDVKIEKVRTDYKALKQQNMKNGTSKDGPGCFCNRRQTPEKGGYSKNMREFMTKVSDYFNEWREDPERGDGQFPRVIIAITGIVAAAVIALLLWWGYGVQEKKREAASQKAQMLQAKQEAQDASDSLALQEAQGLVATTYEEKMQEYMSLDSGEELRQEYLSNTHELSEKVRELQSALEQVQREVSEVVREYRENGSTSSEKVTEKLTVLEKESQTLVENVKSLETKLAELGNVIQTVDREKIPVIREQLTALRTQMEQMRSDMSNTHDKIKDLRREDEKLWNQLSGVEKRLDEVMDKNLDEIDERLDRVGKEMDALEKELRAALKEMEKEMTEKIDAKMDAMSADSLSYRYDQEKNTLYLTPEQKTSK